MTDTKRPNRLTAAFVTAALALGLAATARSQQEVRAEVKAPDVKAEMRAPVLMAEAFSGAATPATTPQGPLKHEGPQVVITKTVGDVEEEDQQKIDESNRVVRLYDEVTDESAAKVIEKMSRLDQKDPTKPITLHIDSPGGSVVAGRRIIDTMKTLDALVYTVCDAWCASMAAVILSAGEPGHRSAQPNATVMVHQLGGSVEGAYNQIKSESKFIDDLESFLVKTMAEASNHTFPQMEALIHPDKYYSATEAREIGLIDRVNPAKHRAPYPLPGPR